MKIKISIQVVAVLFALNLTQNAFAFPLPKAGPGAFSHVVLPATLTTNFDFTGIVSLSNCSGSLVRFEDSLDTDFAMVLTNGHCLESGFPTQGTVVVHQQSNRSFDILDANGDSQGRVRASEVIFGTMTHSDMALYKLTQTLADLRKRYGVPAMTLSSKHPVAGSAIEVISGYWQRGYSCSIEAFVYELREDDFDFRDSIRYSRPGCEVIGGTSGSPIVAAGTRTVIGINNTGNMDGERCTMNNPCEIDAQGKVTYQQGLSYGQETYLLYGCRNAQKELDLTLPTCELNGKLANTPLLRASATR